MIALMWGALTVLAACVLAAVIFGVRAVWREASDDPGLIVHVTEGFGDLGPMPPEIAHEEYLTAPVSMGPRAGTPVPGYNSRLPNLPPTAKADSPPPAAPAAAPLPAPPAPPPVTDVPLAAGQEDPAAAVSTASAPPPVTSPIDAARAATQAVRAMPAGDYLAHLEDATAWEDRPPFTDLLSDDTIARGLPAVK